MDSLHACLRAGLLFIQKQDERGAPDRFTLLQGDMQALRPHRRAGALFFSALVMSRRVSVLLLHSFLGALTLLH